MAKSRVSVFLLACVLLGAGLAAGVWIARSPRTTASTPAPEPPDARVAELEGRVADLESWVRETRQEVASLRHEVEPVEALLEMMKDLEPRLKARRRVAGELAAVATLRNIVSAQAQLQASGKIDVDEDGVGEYGGLREMSGAAAGRMRHVLQPAVLSDVFGALNAHGEAARGGYLFRIFLPDRRGSPVGEPERGFTDDGSVHPDAAEVLWCAYAWPAQRAGTPAPTYFVNQAGTVLSTRDARYTAPGNGPAPLAAFSPTDSLAGEPAEAAEGQDGNTWKLVN